MLKKIFNKMTELFFGLIEKSRFSKMKVFNQILIMIAVMILFVVIQGVWSISINNTMKRYNLNIFQISTKRFNYITTVKTYAEQIEKEYLKVMAKKSSINNLINSEGINGIMNIKDEMLPAARALSQVDPEIADKISAKIVSVLELVNSTIDDEHYIKLVSELNQIKFFISQVNEEAMNRSFVEMANSSRYSRDSTINTILIATLSTLFSLLIGLAVATSMLKPLKAVETAAKSLAVGDLSKPVTTTGCPEVNEVVKGLNQAIHGLRELVININKESDTLFNSSNELKIATIETGRSSNEVARAMEELAKASNEQTKEINEAVEMINRLSDLVNKVSHDTEYMAMSSQQVAESAVIGQKTSVDVTNEINELYSSIQQVAKVINEFTETSAEINEITSVIHGVAEQTTLLALNASIEAARAGEHGKGFGVVARETGMLAVQSEEAATRISDLIVKMNERIDNAVEVMRKSTQRAEMGKALALEATVTFEYIFRALRASIDQIENVAKSAKHMAGSNEKVMEVISAVAAISEENMASTQEVTATAEVQNAGNQEVIALAEDLTGIAGNLRKSVAIFEIEHKEALIHSNDLIDKAV